MLMQPIRAMVLAFVVVTPLSGVASPVAAFSPRSTVKVIEVFRHVAKVDEAVAQKLIKAYQEGGYKALTQAMEGITDRSSVGAIFFRVAAMEGKLADEEAAVLLRTLHTVPGFEKAAKQLLVLDSNLTGALQELRAAQKLKDAGATVKFIRMPFKDMEKAGVSDIDVVAVINSRTVAIESKAYTAPMRWDQISADADTLLHFKEINPSAIGCFLFLTKPTELALEMLEKKGLKAVWGDPAMARYCA